MFYACLRDVEESYIFTSQILHSDDYSQYFYIKGTGKTEKLKKNLRHTVHRNGPFNVSSQKGLLDFCLMVLKTTCLSILNDFIFI